ncbi:MAG: zinc-dependent peptidase [bacterium]|nr:zinc-dependent peptidase [bacterium]
MKSSLFFETWDPFLDKYHLYYRELNLEGKKRFVKRIFSIYQNVEIIGREELEINQEIEILVVSNLVQLTFGLKEFWLYGFEYIYLYPEAFFIKSTDQAVAGSTYQSKIIALSWKDFATDYLHARDGKNVSLAQYAIALVRSVLNGKKFDLKFGSYLDTWFEIVTKECLAKSDGQTMLHMGENQDDVSEVFARCTELFFEKPDVLKKELPTTFAHLCLLLNQDPTNITENYAYDRERLSKRNVLRDLPSHIQIHYKYKNWHWVYNIPFFGLSICPMVLYFITDHVLVQLKIVILVILIVGSVLGLISYSYFKQIGLFKNRLLLLASGITGFGPCLITSFLFINQIYTYPFTSNVSEHKIASFYQDKQYSNQTVSRSVTFIFSDEFLIEYPKARTFNEFKNIPSNPSTIFNGVRYDIRNGLLGLPIIYNRETY